MNDDDLAVFEAVARAGAMSRAAERLHMVQSNVTQRVRALEDELGVALFERHSRGVTLTEAGRRLLPYAARSRDLLAEARAAVTDEGAPAGPLVVGSLETTAALHLSGMLSGFVAAYPAVDLTLVTGTTREMVSGVLDRSLDGAFVGGPISQRGLLAEPVFEEELVLASRVGLRHLEDLAAVDDLRIVVLRAGCSYRQRLEEILARRGIAGLRLLEFGTIEAILATVSAGLGVTLMPRGTLVPAAETGAIRLHTLPPEEGRVTTMFVRREDRAPSAALDALLASARPGAARLAPFRYQTG